MSVSPFARRAARGAAAALLAALAACGDGGPTQAPDDDTPHVLRIENTPLAIRQGDSVSVSLRVQSRSGKTLAGAGAQWTTSDERVAAVTADGRAVGIGVGQAYVRVRLGTLADSVPVRVSTRWRAVAVNPLGGSTCALAWQGKVYCTGYVTAPGVGATPAVYATSLDTARGGPRVATLASTSAPSGCGLTEAGPLVCWGRRPGSGQPATDDGVYEVAAPAPLAQLVSNGGTLCGLSAAGDAFCWGDASSGVLGTGAWASTREPAPVLGGLKFAQLSIGAATTCGVTTGRRVHCWGWNSHRQAGSADSSSYYRPARIAADAEFSAVAVGYFRACALDVSGQVWCWGGAPDRLPAPIGAPQRFESIFAGAGHTCALTAERLAFCWGSNDAGQLGDGTYVPRTLPVAVAEGLRFRSLAPGWAHTCGITTSDELYCWGSNHNGQLGTGGGRPSTVPVRVPQPAS